MNYAAAPASNVTAGFQLISRADHEINVREDFALSIVFSAMAFDCELARLHHKWTSINHLEEFREDLSDDALDAILRKYNSIDKKIDCVGELMFPGGMAAYIKSVPEISNQIDSSFPSLKGAPISQAIQKALFWPRNAILHVGRTKRSRMDALVCRNISALGIYILSAMDKQKRAQAKSA